MPNWKRKEEEEEGRGEGGGGGEQKGEKEEKGNHPKATAWSACPDERISRSLTAQYRQLILDAPLAYILQERRKWDICSQPESLVLPHMWSNSLQIIT